MVTCRDSRAIGRLSVAGALALVLTGCLAVEPPDPAPLAPMAESERRTVRVAEMSNRAPSPFPARLTPANTRMLVELLRRSRRFEPDAVVGPGPGLGGDVRAAGGALIETALLDFRDEDFTETIGHRETKSGRGRRRAVVELGFRLLDARGVVIRQGVLVGIEMRPQGGKLELPDAAAIATGAYWNTAFGLATLDALDRLVRIASESY